MKREDIRDHIKRRKFIASLHVCQSTVQVMASLLSQDRDEFEVAIARHVADIEELRILNEIGEKYEGEEL